MKSCQGKNLFKILDERVKQPVFCDNNVASNIKVSNVYLMKTYNPVLISKKIKSNKKICFSKNYVYPARILNLRLIIGLSKLTVKVFRKSFAKRLASILILYFKAPFYGI